MPSAPAALLHGLVDDAALFPPGNAPMEVGLREHREHRQAPYAALVGPFLCPASRVGELRAALPDGGPLRLSLVVDVGGDATHGALREVAADARLRLVAVEAAHARLGDDAATVGRNLRRLDGVVGYLEVGRRDIDDSLHLVGDDGWHAAKYRTGGTVADAFPSEDELAVFLVTSARRQVPFKLTAGLHHAVRSTDRQGGFEQHGVLNVLVATRAAQAGRGVDAVAQLLADRDVDALVTVVSTWSEDDAFDVRRLFRSFGCCGVTDPIRELADLGLVQAAAA